MSSDGPRSPVPQIRSRTGSNDDAKPYLPVLIIPGFMSSGLEIQKSSLKKSWEGKRVWLNLKSLGFEAIQFGGLGGGDRTTDAITSDADREEGIVMRNLWIQHMALSDDMKTERDGVEVRPIPGLAGVDYLTPGALTNHVSYVFAPVILALQRVGYQEGINLDAASYDWRLPPCVLEERDQYFTRTMNQVEGMYVRNENTPVVLVCHSLGAKIGHYFLNFAKKARGQAWIDQYVHTYMPVGGPHLGAPKALRSVISGDKMSLDAFLTDSEAMLMGRSFGSSPFLFPKDLPPNVPPTVLLRNDGAIQVSIKGSIDTDVFLKNRDPRNRPGKLKLTVVYDGTGVSTTFVRIERDKSVSFQETFTFRSPANGPPPRASLAILLSEPGINLVRWSAADVTEDKIEWTKIMFQKWNSSFIQKIREKMEMYRRSCPIQCLRCLTCWCIIWPLARCCVEMAVRLLLLATSILYCLSWNIFRGTVITADEIAKVSGGSSVLAAAKLRSVSDELDDSMEVEVNLDLVSLRDKRRWDGCCRTKRTTSVTVNIKAIPGPSDHESQKLDTCSAICVQNVDAPSVTHLLRSKRKDPQYLVRSGNAMLAEEAIGSIMDMVRSVYDGDPLDPFTACSSDAPPVRLVKAVYGINLPTEVGAIYKRQRAIVDRSNKVMNYYTLDAASRIEETEHGFIVEHGILKETPLTQQRVRHIPAKYERVCGDGTVPYWSLQHVRSWENECQVTIEELDGAEHREILADDRFHQILIDYVCEKAIADDAV